MYARMCEDEEGMSTGSIGSTSNWMHYWIQLDRTHPEYSTGRYGNSSYNNTKIIKKLKEEM